MTVKRILVVNNIYNATICSVIFSSIMQQFVPIFECLLLTSIIAVPSAAIQQAMVRREAELQLLAQDGYRLPCVDRAAITHQIQLRVVREFGLPDSAVELLWQHHTCPAVPAQRPEVRPVRRVRPRCLHQPASPPYVCNTAPLQKDSGNSCGHHAGNGAGGSGELMMPDIALATASVHQMSLQEATELDLGDGSNHAALYIWPTTLITIHHSTCKPFYPK